MRIKSIGLVTLGLLLFVGPAAAQLTQAPKGFRDLAWGAAPNKKLAKGPGPAAGDMAVYRPRAEKPRPLFKVPVAEEIYSFAKGKFFSASAWLDGRDNFDRIKSALTKEYGPPVETINNYGRFSIAGERRNLWLWKWPDSPVEVRLAYSEKFSRATVTYLNPSIKPPEAAKSSEPPKSVEAPKSSEAATAANVAN